ncbi:LuxR C-terminal-related transcriptional regulator [Lentzea sp. NPDC060358]|uniref:LuxR C-terminal-related transcriptional regulator n=1 Tax=Lentzea sp. NPDC060358 TaxID=3347103 RepID=UPI003652CC83
MNAENAAFSGLGPAEVAGAGDLVDCARCRTAESAGLRPHHRLSRLDSMILEAVATGLSSVRIADRLHLSRQAVDYHVKGMQRRFNAVNRVELVSKACVTGVLDVGMWPPKVPCCFVLGQRVT